MNIIHARKTAPRCYDYYIGGTIGYDVNCQYIAEEMMYINKENLADKINIHINSEGGQVINGVALISAIIMSQVPVYTIDEGYAMSMGGYIWLSAKQECRKIVDFGIMMLHAARFVDDEGNAFVPSDPDEARFLEVVQNQLSVLLETCTGKTKKEVQKILSKDTFYTAQECVDAGYCLPENVISFGKKPEINSKFSVAENIRRISAFYNDLNFNTKTEYQMKNLLVKLGLREEASEAAAVAAFDEVQARYAQLKNDLVAITSERDKMKAEKTAIEGDLKIANDKLAAIEAERKEREKTLVVAFVDDAIKAGKYNAAKRDELVLTASKDFEGFKSLTESIRTAQAPNISAQISTEIEPVAKKLGLEANQVNFEWLDKNNPEKLKEIKANHPELYKALVSEYELKYADL
jgi:ATP-dependent protease ClpP protease subunit